MTTTLDQRMDALARGNEIRLARASLKRRLAHSEVTLAAVLLDPPVEVLSWPIGDALQAQRQWGPAKARRLLAHLKIGAMKPIGELTDRQRRQIGRAIS